MITDFGIAEAVVVEPVGGSDPAADISRYPLANGDLPAAAGYSGYRRLRIGSLSYDAQAAEVEFTVRQQGAPGVVEGAVRLFTVNRGGQEYYVQTTALSSDWQKALPAFAVFFSTFRPVS